MMASNCRVELREVVRVGDHEAQLRMLAPRAVDHRRGEIDADPFARVQRREQIALTAAELEDAQPRPHEEPVHLLDAAVVGAARRPAPRALARDVVPVGDALRPIAFGAERFGGSVYRRRHGTVKAGRTGIGVIRA